MNGTIIEVFSTGVRVRMTQSGKPTGNFNVIDQNSGKTVATVFVWKTINTAVFDMNWVTIPPVMPQVGDTVGPA